MKIKATEKNGSFDVYDNDSNKACSVKYSGLFSASKANTQLHKQKVEIKPKGLMGSTFVILKDDKAFGTIAFDKNKNLIITLSKEIFTLKSADAKNSSFELSEKKKGVIFTMVPEYCSKTLSYNHELSNINSDFFVDKIVELAVYACYSYKLAMINTF